MSTPIYDQTRSWFNDLRAAGWPTVDQDVTDSRATGVARPVSAPGADDRAVAAGLRAGR
ncbi:MAG TPA: hypothetical protein VGX25_03250 [Actinophytocola sp.]|uniref:hypothetical protein n=1 Tax=Actinophytocola sp. TaxID=1872138 RepID=UPI002DDD43A9|nr:hypothetical protein [Actinophytocola sp.]HEV2778395.1 hypothetical protein [Actinophytocola sp.]